LTLGVEAVHNLGLDFVADGVEIQFRYRIHLQFRVVDRQGGHDQTRQQQADCRPNASARQAFVGRGSGC